MKHYLKTILAISLFLAVAPAALLAGPIAAYEFTSPGTDSTNGSWTFGINFSVGGSNLAVSSLGYYDQAGDGFLDNHEVGIYNSVGTLLASTTVTSADTLIGHFRYASIAPITLLSGQSYRMVGVSHSDLYTYNVTGFAADSRITYLGDFYDAGTTLFDPVGQFQDGPQFFGFFGPNILLDTGGSSVPEPATYGMMAGGLAVVSLAARRRGRQS
jgi:hypothetical protein